MFELKYIIVFLLLFVAGLSNGLMDKISFHFSECPAIIKNNPQYWDASESWKNKYKNRDPKQGAAFIGSTTVFVAFTDGWHLLKMIMMWSFSISVALLFSVSNKTKLFIVLVSRLCIGAGFYLTYNII